MEFSLIRAEKWPDVGLTSTIDKIVGIEDYKVSLLMRSKQP
jgi:hypothetical protein